MPFEIRKLPVFSPVAAKLLELISRERVRYREVADLLLLDVALTAGLLRLANSALFGSRYEIVSVTQALAMLGIERVAALITTLSLGNLLHPVAQMPMLARLWRHNLATALAASIQADGFGGDPDTAYVQGLLHDVGRLVMLVAFRERYAALYDHPDASSALDDLMIVREREAFGCDNRQATLWLVRQWSLPPSATCVDPKTMMFIDFACRAAVRAGFGIAANEGPAVDEELDANAASLRDFLRERVPQYEKAYPIGAAT